MELIFSSTRSRTFNWPLDTVKNSEFLKFLILIQDQAKLFEIYRSSKFQMKYLLDYL